MDPKDVSERSGSSFAVEFARQFAGTIKRGVGYAVLLAVIIVAYFLVTLWPVAVAMLVLDGGLAAPSDAPSATTWIGLGGTFAWWAIAGAALVTLNRMIEDERRLSGEPDTKVLKRLIWGESDD